MNDNAATKQDILDLESRITELITSGFQTVNDRFDRLEARIDHLESRMDKLENEMRDLVIRVGALEVGQREMNVRLDRLDGRITALHDDVVELYRRSTETRRKFAGKLKALPEQDRRLKRLERFAISAARRLGLTLGD